MSEQVGHDGTGASRQQEIFSQTICFFGAKYYLYKNLNTAFKIH